jgi:3D-(3,5/4)-trihydroxycyclohexane-1,2-dione acylhydrolase (decyclizing)
MSQGSSVGDTIKLTVAQAIVRYLSAQFIEIDGVACACVAAASAFSAMAMCRVWARRSTMCRTTLPLYRGQNEQSMGFAAAAYAKYHLRQRFMFCTASPVQAPPICLTAAALAHANRLPMLMLCGDTFLTRLPDPVLQQLEHFGNPALGLNDAFKAGQPLLGSDHPSRADHSVPARGHRHDARPCRLRPGLSRSAAGCSGLDL